MVNAKKVRLPNKVIAYRCMKCLIKWRKKKDAEECCNTINSEKVK